MRDFDFASTRSGPSTPHTTKLSSRGGRSPPDEGSLHGHRTNGDSLSWVDEWWTNHPVVRFRQMTKSVVAVGYDVPTPEIESVQFKSNDSILGADIVIFCPRLKDYVADKSFAGQPLISESDSDQLRQQTLHWKSELTITLRHGKTVFLFLVDIDDCHIHSGIQNVSGTGRSTRVTNVVHPYEPYSSVPIEDWSARTHRSHGDRIKPTDKLGCLSSYWKEFGPYSYYDVYLDQATIPSLVTQTGDRVVGGFFRSNDWKGTIVLLPLVDFEYMIEEREKQFIERARKGKSPSKATRKKAEASVGQQFVNALVQIDKMVRVEIDRTPPPQWSNDKVYSLKEEDMLEQEIANFDKKIAELHTARSAVLDKFKAAGTLRGLLYESGKPLESALLEALRLLEFRAETYRDVESEFDVLFVDPEGERLLGEAEGRIEKAINIDKLDQLNRNVQEEFAKRSDTKFSKGVLFGNAFRLTPLDERRAFFTEKCIAGAARLGFSLVRTPDLFPIARHLREHPDTEFAKKCRAEILNTYGKIVVFPSIPTTTSSTMGHKVLGKDSPTSAQTRGPTA